MMTTHRGVVLSVFCAGVTATAGLAAATPAFTIVDESVSVWTEIEMGVLQQEVVVDSFSAGFAEITAESPGVFQQALVTDLGPYQTNTTVEQMFEGTADRISGFASFSFETNDLNDSVDSGYDIYQNLSVVFSLSEGATVGFSTFIENNGLRWNPEITLMDSGGNILLAGAGEGELDLAAGEYTLVALLSGRDKFREQTSQGASFGYSFTFLPTPGTAGMLGMAGLVLAGRRRR